MRGEDWSMGKILVIEDDELMREMLVEMLSREGYETVSAENGYVGLSVIKKESFDLVITDIVMPEKEGLEIILTIRKSQNIPIIAVSGGGKNLPMNYLKAAEKFGADFSFTKPIDRKAFLAAVRDCLANYQV
jgi:two-component system response regulator (stage 0 sporulation protein F)